MARTALKNAEINERRRKVAAFTLNKYEQQDIADLLGVHQSTISRDIAFLNKQWLAATENDIKKMKAREVAELERMERDAAAMYVTAKNSDRPKDAVAWMEERLKIKDRRAKLLGLDTPIKLDVEEKKQIVVNLVMQDCGAKNV